jgi:hypothetical protein
MDPGHMYGYTPFAESSDPIEARKTRRVGCLAPEAKYSGTWSDSTDPSYYEGKAKSAADSGASVAFTFHGKDIYWRAVKGPDLGKADVFLDGVLQTTVDCWASILSFTLVSVGYFCTLSTGVRGGWGNVSRPKESGYNRFGGELSFFQSVAARSLR